MKKIVIYFTALLLISNVAFAQPIQPYNESGYTKLQIYQFAMGTTTFSRNYNREILGIVLAKLTESNELENAKRDAGGQITLQWAMKHTSYQRRQLQNFMNSGRDGDKIKFFLDKRHFDGIVGVFSFGNCTVPIFKTVCMNLLDVALESTINEKDLEKNQNNGDDYQNRNNQQADNLDETDYDENRNYNDDGYSEEKVVVNNSNSNCSNCGQDWYGPTCRPVPDQIVECPSGYQYRFFSTNPVIRACNCPRRIQNSGQTYTYTSMTGKVYRRHR